MVVSFLAEPKLSQHHGFPRATNTIEIFRSKAIHCTHKLRLALCFSISNCRPLSFPCAGRPAAENVAAGRKRGAESVLVQARRGVRAKGERTLDSTTNIARLASNTSSSCLLLIPLHSIPSSTSYRIPRYPSAHWYQQHWQFGV